MNQAEVLERLLEGDPLPDADVPEDLGRLAMLADLIADTAAPVEAPVQMAASARTELRNALIREANLRAESPPPLLTRLRDALRGRAERIAYSRRAAATASMTAVLLSTGGVATATNASLPGDLFYDLKLAAEDVVLLFAGDDVAHGAGLLDQAESRLAEAETAVERDLHAVAGDALRLADEHTRDGAQHLLRIYLDTGDTQVLTDLRDWVITTERRLAFMPPLTGPSADALEDLRTTLQRIGDRVQVLSTGACADCDLGVHDDEAPEEDIARGREADGTPPMPPGTPVDMTFIPPADQPFQACPCTTPSTRGGAPQAAPAPAPAPPPAAPPADPAAGAPPREEGAEPSGAGSGDGGSDGGGSGPLPLPLPDTDEVGDQLPDPVRDTVEEIIEQLPVDPAEPAAPPAPEAPAPEAPAREAPAREAPAREAPAPEAPAPQPHAPAAQPAAAPAAATPADPAPEPPAAAPAGPDLG